MRAVFLGLEPEAGTSANMQLVLCGAAVHPYFRDEIRNGRTEFVDFGLADREGWRQLSAGDLLVVNLSLHSSMLEKLYLNGSFVRKNIIFLIGKYYQNDETELRYLSRWYRIPPGRICVIPFNPRFQRAYELHKISEYLTWQQRERTLENMELKRCLDGMLDAMVRYKDRKGEIYYG